MSQIQLYQGGRLSIEDSDALPVSEKEVRLEFKNSKKRDEEINSSQQKLTQSFDRRKT